MSATERPPSLPDTNDWVKRAPGDVIEAGTPYVARHSDGGTYFATDERFVAGSYPTIWTPPPAPREPWRAISEDWDRPTDAYVNGTPGRYWRGPDWIFLVAPGGEAAHAIRPESVTAVELLHTHDPVTQVPVERALIEQILRSGGQAGLRTLAALADGAES